MSSHRFVRREQRDPEAEAAAAATVKRYWPGRAPHWYAEDGQAPEEQPIEDDQETAFGRAFREDVQATTGVAAPVIVKRVRACLCAAACLQPVGACFLHYCKVLKCESLSYWARHLFLALPCCLPAVMLHTAALSSLRK